MSAGTTRRALIGGAGLAAVVAAASTTAPVLAAADPFKSPRVSPELVTLIDAVRQHDARCAAGEVALDAAKARWEQACAGLPHATVDMGESWPADLRVWSTENRTHVTLAERQVADWKVKRPRDEHFYQQVRRFVAAVRRRDRASAKLRTSTGLDAVYRETVRLDDECFDAVKAVEGFPVHGIADLNAVLAFMSERDHMDNDYRITVLADGIRRLAGEASA